MVEKTSPDLMKRVKKLKCGVVHTSVSERSRVHGDSRPSLPELQSLDVPCEWEETRHLSERNRVFAAAHQERMFQIGVTVFTCTQGTCTCTRAPSFVFPRLNIDIRHNIRVWQRSSPEAHFRRSIKTIYRPEAAAAARLGAGN